MNDEIKISDEARSFATVITDMNKAAVLSNRNLSHPVYNDCLLHEIQLLLNKRDKEIAELRKDKERLDWLSKLPDLRWSWMCRMSKDNHTLRCALDAAMSNETKGGGE